MNTDTNPTEELPFQPTASFDDQRIARVYAESLINAATEKKVVDEIKTELQETAQNLFQQQPEFEKLLTSGVISRDAKVDVLRKVFEETASTIFFNFLMVLAEHDRLSLLKPIFREFVALDDRRNRRIPVLVTSAVALSEEQTGRLQNDLQERFQLEPVLHTQVDPSILGGVIVKVADWVFDRSVRSQLNGIRKQLLSRGSHVIQSGRDRFSSHGAN